MIINKVSALSTSKCSTQAQSVTNAVKHNETVSYFLKFYILAKLHQVLLTPSTIQVLTKLCAEMQNLSILTQTFKESLIY